MYIRYLLLVVLKVCFLANVISMETLITMELRKIILSITASRIGRIICEPSSYWNYLLNDSNHWCSDIGIDKKYKYQSCGAEKLLINIIWSMSEVSQRLALLSSYWSTRLIVAVGSILSLIQENWSTSSTVNLPFRQELATWQYVLLCYFIVISLVSDVQKVLYLKMITIIDVNFCCTTSFTFICGKILL